MLNGNLLTEGGLDLSVGCEIIVIVRISVGERGLRPIENWIIAFAGYPRISRSFVYDEIQRSLSNRSKCTLRNNEVSLDTVKCYCSGIMVYNKYHTITVD